MISVWIDEMTLCLKDGLTGELIQTEVLRVKRNFFYRNLIRRTVGMLIGVSY